MDYTYENITVRDGPSADTCIPFPRYNRTIITDVYAGIPENLLLNAIGFLLLVILFGLLRKKAWNYGRLALLHKSDNRWMELFYGVNENRDTDPLCVETSINSQLSQLDRGFLSWIVTAFKITDDELLQRAGPDGLLYIMFERCLIILTVMMLIVSLCIALPINFHGSMQPGDSATFSHTTLSNLEPTSFGLWVYTVLLLSYLPVGGFIMRRRLKQVRDIRPTGEFVARTLLIIDIPKQQCTVENLTEYFKEAFPALTVEDITLAHDIRRLSKLDEERDCAEQARLYCESYAKKKEPLKMYPYPCGQILGYCCNKQVDAQEFYTNEEIRLTALVEEEKNVALSKTLGVAFVTLGTPGAAKTMRKQLRSSPNIKWIVDYAPMPSDIFWENLSIPRPCWYLNAVLINCALGLILFFITTPAVIVTAINKLPITGEIKILSPVLSSFLPTVLLVSVAALMPALVGRSESLVRHWTRSSLNRVVMRKTLLLLLLMVLILPSLGLTSAAAFLDWTMNDRNNTAQWECVFLPDQGALFVNYVITAALLGSGLELVRFPELALYTFRLCIARSRAERIHVRKAVLWEFPLGGHYAWLLLVFTMTTVYSLACPLITPFGLLYLVVKHLVDRHNLCFAYGPSIGGGQLAGAAVSAAGAAPVLAQAALLALGLVRVGLSSLAAVQLTGLCASILGLVTGVTLPLSKPKTAVPKRDLSTGQNFVAPVLRKNQISIEETISTASNSEINLPSPTSTISSVQESPKLYQNYGGEQRV
ncbi:PREDICTED: CSC1-like protein 2 isoform X1 [Acromyrmex echinatior]|uniref:CSC1-like protein 2 isoform X1 n=1 Tax=Acromyrmex echinatior TaxID=103372 RepID=UPI000580E918|nr:PREDICTED: CSC1-like protein 2 isoform X1 [Acromyrmex echinatior]